MPFVLKPIEEIKSIEIQPTIEKVQNTELDSMSVLYLFAVFLFFYFFRSFFFGLLLFTFKIVVLLGFAFLTYSLFLT